MHQLCGRYLPGKFGCHELLELPIGFLLCKHWCVCLNCLCELSGGYHFYRGQYSLL